MYRRRVSANLRGACHRDGQLLPSLLLRLAASGRRVWKVRCCHRLLRTISHRRPIFDGSSMGAVRWSSMGTPMETFSMDHFPIAKKRIRRNR